MRFFRRWFSACPCCGARSKYEVTEAGFAFMRCASPECPTHGGH